VKNQDHQQVETLLESGIDPNLGEEQMEERRDDYPLKIAIRQDDVKMFQLLLKHGMKWQIKEKEAYYPYCARNWIALDYAGEHNALKMAWFLTHELSAPSKLSITRACEKGLLEFIIIVLFSGVAHFHEKLDYMIELSIEHNQRHVFNYLVTKITKDMWDPGWNNMIACAGKYGRLEMLALLLDHPLFVNDYYAGAAYSGPCSTGQLEAVKMMLAKGVSPNYCEFNALTVATEHGHLEIVKLLAPFGVDHHSILRASDSGRLDIYLCLIAAIPCNGVLTNGDILKYACDAGHAIEQALYEHLLPQLTPVEISKYEGLKREKEELERRYRWRYRW
jgi:ankyrin repeat protein